MNASLCILPDMNDVTQLLNAIEHGDRQAAGQLLPLIYDELRKLAAQKLARESSGRTLQATALVHEAYMRLVGDEDAQRWDNRGHFFAAAAEAMRRILIENARRKRSLKGGGDWRRVNLAGIEPATMHPATSFPPAARRATRVVPRASTHARWTDSWP